MPVDVAAYTFTSWEEGLAYPRYNDLATGEVLTASPGQSYQVVAMDDGLPVPPADGRWAPAPARPAKAAKSTEGGE